MSTNDKQTRADRLKEMKADQKDVDALNDEMQKEAEQGELDKPFTRLVRRLPGQDYTEPQAQQPQGKPSPMNMGTPQYLNGYVPPKQEEANTNGSDLRAYEDKQKQYAPIQTTPAQESTETQAPTFAKTGDANTQMYGPASPDEINNRKGNNYFVDENGVEHWDGKPAKDTFKISVKPRSDYGAKSTEYVQGNSSDFVQGPPATPYHTDENGKTIDNETGEEVFQGKDGEWYKVNKDGEIEFAYPEQQEGDMTPTNDGSKSNMGHAYELEQLEKLKETADTPTGEIESPEVKRETTLQDFYKSLHDNPRLSEEQQRKANRRRKVEQSLAALADMANAFGNIATASKAGIAWNAPNPTMSEAINNKWEKWQAQQDAKYKEYATGLGNAALKDESNYISRLRNKAQIDMNNAKIRQSAKSQEIQKARLELQKYIADRKAEYTEALNRLTAAKAKIEEEKAKNANALAEAEKAQAEANVELAKAKYEEAKARTATERAEAKAARKKAEAAYLSAQANYKKAKNDEKLKNSQAHYYDKKASNVGKNGSNGPSVSQQQWDLQTKYYNIPSGERSTYDNKILMNPSNKYTIMGEAVNNHSGKTSKKGSAPYVKKGTKGKAPYVH